MIPPLEFTLQYSIDPTRLFRMLNSQHQLRKWFMPSIIMAKNTIIDTEMRRIHFHCFEQKKNQLLRYYWYPEDWPQKKGKTILTFTLTNYNNKRNSNQEGIRLDIHHDRWPSNQDREQQGKIWPKMITSLSALVANESCPQPWWHSHENQFNEQIIRLRELKSKLLIWHKNANFDKNRNISMLCETIDRNNCWYYMEDSKGVSHITFRIDGKALFAIRSDIQISFFWSEFPSEQQLLLGQLVERFLVEQDYTLSPHTQPIETIKLNQLQLSLFAAWLKDLVDCFTHESY